MKRYTPAILIVSCFTLMFLLAWCRNRNQAPEQKQTVGVEADFRSMPPPPGSIELVGWNTEQNDSAPAHIAEVLANTEGVDVWALCEVHADDLPRYAQAAAEGEQGRFQFIVGASSFNGQKLAIIYDTSQFEMVGKESELGYDGDDGNGRSPLCVRFREQAGREFCLVVNHLRRGDPAQRELEAKALNAWVREQELPVICMGDFNFDWDLRSERGNPAFDQFVKDGVWEWIRPPRLMRTQADERYNSILDFAFCNDDVARLSWRASSEILVLPPGSTVLKRGFRGDVAPGIDDDKARSDHRPILCTLTLPEPAAKESAK